MKVLPFKIPKTGDPAILTQIDSGSHFYDILHKHPEYQITLIEEGSGTLICDEYLGRFEPGTVVMFGTNQPHVFKCDEEFYQGDFNRKVYASSVFFDDNVLRKVFFDLEETKGLIGFFDLGKSGFKFSDEIASEATPILQEIQKTSKIELIIHFLRIVQCLMKDVHPEKLSNHQRQMNDMEGQRMNDIMQYTFNNFKKHITINEIAAIASMTPNAFCKYFKIRTRKTYLNYLNELRISYACRKLREHDLSVSQAAHQSGFKNLSHFNRCFKKYVGITPGRYGKKINNVSE